MDGIDSGGTDREDDVLDAYSRVVSGVAERLIPRPSSTRGRR